METPCSEGRLTFSSVWHFYPGKRVNTKDSEHSYSVRNGNVCSDCNVEVQDEGIQCELCDYWFCVPCSKMSNSFFDELVNSSLSENIIWYCEGCNKAIPGVKKVLRVVNKMKESQDQMNARLDRMEEKLNNVDKQTELEEDYKIDQALYDFKEREMRKNNVIIFNLPEPKANDNEEEKRLEESENIQKVCQSADVRFEVEEILRLGQKKTGQRAKPRPVKVIFKDEVLKRKLIRNQEEVQRNTELKDVTITPDYAIRQRNMNEQMKTEVAKRRQTDPTFTFRKLKNELSNLTKPERNETRAYQSSRTSAAFAQTESRGVSASQQGHASFSRSQIPVPTPGHLSSQGATGIGPPLGRGSGRNVPT